MDQAVLVAQQIEDGEELVEELLRNGFDVAAAAWVKPSDEDRWLLYVVSKVVDEQGLAAAYRAIHPTLSKRPHSWVSLFELKLIGPSNPIAADILELNRKYPGRNPTRTRRPHLGGMAIDQAYIYPTPGQPPPWLARIKRQFPSAEALSISVPSDALEFPTFGPYLNHVNATDFLGKTPGTVLFMGPEGGNRPLGTFVFAYRPEGWNTMLNPETQKWEEVRFAATGESLYQSADFAPLLALQAKD
jgi:hypothetical protein